MITPFSAQSASAAPATLEPVRPTGRTGDAPPLGTLPALSAAFGKFAVFVLLWNMIVIAVGVTVRATGSGDGCGANWPTCNGELVPIAPALKTIIEVTHRYVSGVDGLLVLGLVGWGIAKYRAHRPLFWSLLATLFMTAVEAWVGAYLVRHHLVAQNATIERAVWISLHLVSTFVLLLAITLCAWWATGRKAVQLAGQGAVSAALALAFAGMVVLGVSGAITALGDTLHPATSHSDAIAQSLAAGADFLQKLRLYHPLIAGSVGLYLLLIAGLIGHLRPSPWTKRYANTIFGLFFLEMGVGLLNVWLLAPVWMQLIHLLIADLFWIALVLFSAAALERGVPHVEDAAVTISNWGDSETQAGSETASRADAPSLSGFLAFRATVDKYIVLTKPRVISLLLFTTLTAMFIAKRGYPGTGLLLAVALGGFLSAGAANAINMVIDRDIDGRMKRTAKRPTVTQSIPTQSALRFGLICAGVSFTTLWLGANLLAAMLSLAGLVFYVCVYTLFLKRRTWHNIVIGGAAGAFPPLVGWAAVTNDLSPLAWYLFAIIFVWTPAHFWALALLIKDDYKDAGVPMLPVVHGERATVIQIAAYAVLTAIVSILPLKQGLVGVGYAIFAALLGIGLIWRSGALARQTDRPHALGMYKYSMAYLFLLFLALAVDAPFRH